MPEKLENVKLEISTLTILKIVGTLLALWVAYSIREVFAIFFVALVLSALISPLAAHLEQRKIPRGLAVLIIYVGLLVLIGVALIGLIPPIINESGQLIGNSVNLVKFIYDQIKSWPVLGSALSDIDSIQSGLQALQAGLTKGVPGIFSTLQDLAGGLAAFVLVLALTYYLVVEESAFWRFFRSMTPHRYHVYLGDLLMEVQKKMGAWLRGQIVLGLTIGFCVYIGLRILGVPYALVLAFFAGLMEFIPYIGPIISAIPAVLIALSTSVFQGVLVVLMYMVIQWCENHLLVPTIMRRAIGINPIVSILALLVGAKLGGIVGAVLAIPVATAIMVFTQDFFAREENEV
ncbi:MAG: AI-2E family transporter [bacterium]